MEHRILRILQHSCRFQQSWKIMVTFHKPVHQPFWSIQNKQENIIETSFKQKHIRSISRLIFSSQFYVGYRLRTSPHLSTKRTELARLPISRNNSASQCQSAEMIPLASPNTQEAFKGRNQLPFQPNAGLYNRYACIHFEHSFNSVYCSVGQDVQPWLTNTIVL